MPQIHLLPGTRHLPPDPTPLQGQEPSAWHVKHWEPPPCYGDHGSADTTGEQIPQHSPAQAFSLPTPAQLTAPPLQGQWCCEQWKLGKAAQGLQRAGTAHTWYAPSPRFAMYVKHEQIFIGELPIEGYPPTDAQSETRATTPVTQLKRLYGTAQNCHRAASCLHIHVFFLPSQISRVQQMARQCLTLLHPFTILAFMLHNRLMWPKSRTDPEVLHRTALRQRGASFSCV